MEAEAPEALLVSAREKKGETFSGSATPAEPCLGSSSAAAGKASGGPGSNLRRVTEQGQRSDRETKTVTFDENHQVGALWHADLVAFPWMETQSKVSEKFFFIPISLTQNYLVLCYVR